MKYQAFFLTLIAIVTAVIFVPRPGQGEAAAIEAPSADGRLPESNPGGWSHGEHVLARSGDGHFYANVRVTGTDVLMMVDTGASFVALTGEDADALGLAWHPDDAVMVARGASGPVNGVPVQLDEVEVGGHMVRNVRAAIIPDGLDVSLLGQSFLSQIDRVEIARDEMVLAAD